MAVVQLCLWFCRLWFLLLINVVDFSNLCLGHLGACRSRIQLDAILDEGLGISDNLRELFGLVRRYVSFYLFKRILVVLPSEDLKLKESVFIS